MSTARRYRVTVADVRKIMARPAPKGRPEHRITKKTAKKHVREAQKIRRVVKERWKTKALVGRDYIAAVSGFTSYFVSQVLKEHDIDTKRPPNTNEAWDQVGYSSQRRSQGW